LKQSDLIIKEFKREYRITLDDFTVIVDANITLEYNGKEYNYLLELENQKSFNYKKYYKLELEGIEVPTIIVCSNRKVYNYCKKVKVLKVGLNLEGLIKKLKNDMTQKECGYKVNKF
jgi:hypothetical protein